jgi:hypothetical protein
MVPNLKEKTTLKELKKNSKKKVRPYSEV